MADSSARGRFLWHDLLTSDPAAAHSFYGKAVGWTSIPFEGNPEYVMFAAPTGPLGGAGKVEEAPHWVAYIGTPNIEGTIAKAKVLGATVKTDVTQIPNGGSYAILKDPQGAVFGLYQYSTEPSAASAPKRGEFSWYELGTTDGQAALSFYGELFGWEKLEEHDMGPMGFYYLFGRDGTQVGGMFSKPAQMGAPSWMLYVRVKDIDETVKKVKSAGGTLINGPMEVPGGEWIAQFTDPQGALFAAHVVKADLKAKVAAKPAAKAASKVKKAAAKKAPVKAAKKTAKKSGKKLAKKPIRKSAKKKASAKTMKRSAKKASKGKKKVKAKRKK
jgi:predicted enzyme related to lactoylglutathione lyase